MEQVRHQKLDTYGEEAGEGLDLINTGTEQVNDARNAALEYMARNNVTSYIAAGVRFTYTPGAAKVSVKRVKDRGDNKAADVVDAGEDEGSTLGGFSSAEEQ